MRSVAACVVLTDTPEKTSSYAIVNKLGAWYRALGLSGASSHSGRRTAIIKWARQISSVGGSLRKVLLFGGTSGALYDPTVHRG